VLNSLPTGRGWSRASLKGKTPRDVRGWIMGIITISRQVGSFGEEIGILVGKKLGYDVVDQAKVHKLAQECDAEFTKACTLYETEAKPGFFESFFFQSAAYTSLFESLNYELASQGNVVIIGRGAQIVLRDLPGVFKARIVAPLDVRVERVMARGNVPRDEARRFVDKYDSQRRALIRSVFDKDLRDWDLYDLILNTKCYTAEKGAEILCKAVEAMNQLAEGENLQERLKNLAFAKRIESHIKKSIATSPYRNIEITATSDGAVTLEGFVQDKKTKEKAGEIAKSGQGVTSVQNNLRTTELSF
jgi:hypothetical protein